MADGPLSIGPVTAKLARPPVGDATLRSDTLVAYRESLSRRLTVVCAPAGYGKSTVTAAAIEQLARGSVWYKLDVLDRDPVLFVASLTEALRRTVPGFGEAIVERLKSSASDPFPLDHLLAMFARDCDALITAETHIVLDDYQEAAESSATNRALDYLLRSLPPTVRFVVISRYEPAIQMARLRLEDQVAFLGPGVLKFDVPQAVEVLAVRTGTEPSAELVARLVEIAEGWPASIVLAGLALDWETPSSVEAALSDPRLKQDIYSYLAEQVYEREDRAARRFLKRTCCLEHMTPELAARVARSRSAHRLLRHLAANRVFTFAAGEANGYRYHNLFREFLRQKLVQDEGEEALRTVQRDTAAALEEAGELELAVELFFGANEPREALRVVARAGEALLDDVPSDRLASWVDRLPPHLRLHDPWPRLMAAHLDSRAGDYNGALRHIAEAQQSFESAGDERGLYEAFSMRECALFWRGDTAAAIAACEQALAHAQTDSQRVHTLLSLGSAAVESRDWELAERAFVEADRLAAEAAPRELPRAQAVRAHALYMQGEVRRAQIAMPDLSLVKSSPSVTIAATNIRGMILVALASYTDASNAFEQAHDAACKYGYATLRDMISDGLGLAEGSCGRFERGLARIRDATATDAAEQQPGLRAWARCHEATLLRRSGHVREALPVARQAVQLVAASRDAYACLNFQANLLFAEGLTGSEAVPGLDSVATEADRSRVAFVELKAGLYAAILSALRGRVGDCAARMREVVPRQLALGHLHILSQELCPRPECARAAVSIARDHGLKRQLTDALATHWRFAELVDALASDDQGFADLAVHAARTHADDDVLARVIAVATRLGTPEADAAVEEALALRPGAARGPMPRLSDLSRREKEVLGLMADGLRNPDIADRLFITQGTVKTHVNHILSKLGVKTRVQAILLYRDAL